MRCPKCGYISFDHVETCLKCKKEIKDNANLSGTVYNVSPPNFLNLQEQETEPEEVAYEEEGIETHFDDAEVDMDMVDPDLEILLDDEPDSNLDLSEPDEDFEINLDDETGEEPKEEDVSLDLNQFEEGADEEEDLGEFSMDLPDELSDLSDLEQDTEDVVEQVAEKVEPVVTDESDEDPFLNDLNFDLDLDSLDMPQEDDVATVSMDEPAEIGEELSMNSLELDEDDASPREDGDLNMDEDLNFDLDLGGLTLDKK